NTPEPGNIVDHPAFREAAVENRLSQWERDRFGERLWNKDFTLWSKEHVPEITDRLGWLELPQSMPERTDEILALADSLKKDGIKKVVLLGMGGSSLAPDVFSKTFEPEGGAPALSVLDSTHPDAVKGMDESIDPAKTFFVVSSKSGTTLETLSLFRYFWSRVKGVSETPGRHFAAVSDPGTPLADLARERGFRKIFAANPEVGGRYSALTHFGLVPAGLMGVDIRAVLESGRTMAAACGPEVAAGDNPGLRLGAALGEFALQGRDKVTFLASPALSAVPIWMEQLIAESTGKTGKGIVPVADEPLGDVEAYGPDRFFAAFFLKGDGAPELESRLNALEEAGHPVARFALESKTDLGGIFFLWETAVAAAGAVLGIQPFNQPDVQLAKELAKKAMSGEGGGSESDVETVAASSNGFGGRLKAWMDLARGGDYAALQAYLAPDEHVWKALQEIRTALRARLGTAVTVGYGPRFLHSTGQLHKGGPNTGLFLQIVDRPDDAVPVPETDFNFRDLIHAQTVGDYRAMKQRDRRVIRVDLGKDPGGGLKRILEAVLD
ncbi:MAG: phosphoheptose isomerase, partial [Acidobacteriota bacterium]